MTPLPLKDAINRFPGGLLITDKESRVLYASSALERRTGYAVAEIVGKKPGQLWGGKMKKAFYRKLWQTIGTERQAFVGQARNSKKSGAQYDEHIFIMPIQDTAGMTRYYAEIHPELSGRGEEEAFGREFLKRAGSLGQGKDFFSWMFRTLSKKKDGTFGSAESLLWQGNFHDAGQFLREIFVAPMEKMFVRRQEDALLVTRAQEDPKHFSGLYEKYALSVREYFLRRLSGDLAVAEDLTQEVFVRAFRYLPSFRSANASYYTYLLHVAHNVLVNYYRKERHATLSYEGHEEMAGESAPVMEQPFRDDMETLLQSVTADERAIMLFKYRDGLKVREIAEKVGKSENAIKLVLSRTRKKLKKRLS